MHFHHTFQLACALACSSLALTASPALAAGQVQAIAGASGTPDWDSQSSAVGNGAGLVQAGATHTTAAQGVYTTQSQAALDAQQGTMRLFARTTSFGTPSPIYAQSDATARLNDTLTVTGAASPTATLSFALAYDVLYDLSDVATGDAAAFNVSKEGHTDFALLLQWQVPNPAYGQPGSSDEESPTLLESRRLEGGLRTFRDGANRPWYSKTLQEEDVHSDLSRDVRQIVSDEATGIPAQALWTGAHVFNVLVPTQTPLTFKWETTVHAACKSNSACTSQVDGRNTFSLGLTPSAGQVLSSDAHAFLQASAVPEPNSLLMSLAGLGALLLWRKRQASHA